MRIFSNALEMVKEVERDLYEMGIFVNSHTVQDKNVENNEEYRTMELFGYSYMLTGFEMVNLKEMVSYLNGNWTWIKDEFYERISTALYNPGLAFHKREDLWSQYLRDGKFSYTYNERIRDQLPNVIEELTKRPNTRQAIITVYDKHLDMNNWGGIDRVCCSMYYQLYLRKGKLSMLYCMRSCDFLTHFVHDVALAILLLKYIQESIGAESGVFTHFVGSLHAFKKDLDARGIF